MSFSLGTKSFMAGADLAQRLQVEVKRLAEMDQKRQAELDELVKAKAAAD